MKTLTPAQNKPMLPFLFQIAAHLGDHVRAAGLKKSAPALARSPFAELMSHPEQLKAALEAATAATDDLAASRSPGFKGAKPGERNRPPGNGAISSDRADVPRELRRIELFLEAPSAQSVRLAADFTDWEKYPLDMMPTGDGVWFSVLRLAPGQYSYRFIVDGQWCDDPCSTRRVPNPFGTENAVMVVT